LADATLLNGAPADRAGLLRETSTRLSNSLMLGMRHWPAVDPSLRPHWPLASWLAADKAVDHAAGEKHPAFFNQMSPVNWSVTVPSLLSR